MGSGSCHWLDSHLVAHQVNQLKIGTSNCWHDVPKWTSKFKLYDADLHYFVG